jgi:hypothetical protein
MNADGQIAPRPFPGNAPSLNSFCTPGFDLGIISFGSSCPTQCLNQSIRLIMRLYTTPQPQARQTYVPPRSVTRSQMSDMDR